jgi:hypothetical protein
VDLAFLDLEINIIQCLYTWESFGDIFHFQKYLSQLNFPPFPLFMQAVIFPACM